jgi:peptide chain release factor subunit 3
LEHKSIICAGYSAVCHIHTVAEEVTVKVRVPDYVFRHLLSVRVYHDNFLFLRRQALICTIDKKTGEKSKTRPRFVKQDQTVIMRLEAAGVICLETFKDFPQLGRFALRDEGTSCPLSCASVCS